MTIWVDADACPNVIKEILYRAAERMQMPLVLVANQSLRVRHHDLFVRCASRQVSTLPITKLFGSVKRAIW